MNAFGVRRFALRQILLLILLCAGPALSAQELKSTTLGLIYKSLDLKFTVEELSGEASGAGM